MWLMGRKSPLTICGSAHCLERLEPLMEAYNWREWPGFYPTCFVRAPEGENVLLVEGDEFRILATPVQHLVPTLGLRVEVKGSNQVLAYSADTEPCEQFIRLAAGADLLVHEATGATMGHSSAAQAGRVAREAGARRLLLIHYDPASASPEALAAEAATTFGGPVAVAQDFDTFEF
jgi:ribonuclease Z